MSAMRTAQSCLFLSALTGVFACTTYDEPLRRPQSEKDSTFEREGGGANGTGSDVRVDAGDASHGWAEKR